MIKPVTVIPYTVKIRSWLHLGLPKSGLISGVVLILNIKYNKSPKISNILFHTFLAKCLLLSSSFLKYLVKLQIV